jgi:hypothetical protein
MKNPDKLYFFNSADDTFKQDCLEKHGPALSPQK